MQPQITLYTTTWCGDCIRSKSWLQAHSVPYKEVNIEENKEALSYVEKVNNGLHSVPTILFPDGSTLIEPTNQALEEKIQRLKLV